MRRIQFTFRVLIIAFFLLYLSACSLPEGILSSLQGAAKQDLPTAEVLFKVVLRQPLQQDTRLMLEVLDDVTGLYFNATRFELTRDEDLHYSVRIPMSVTTEVKYRYIRVGDGTEYEFDSRQQQVRYRILKVNGPEIILDHIARLINKP